MGVIVHRVTVSFDVWLVALAVAMWLWGQL
jgi:hypothetical protein